MNVLFVCTGNTCRSPMAESLFRQMTDGMDVEIRSAGISAFPGQPASENTIQVLKERGIDTQHQSQAVTHELVQWADYIFTMTLAHKWHLQSAFPEAKDKIYTLKEFVREEGKQDEDQPFDWDILDPFGGDLEEYRHCAGEIAEHLNKLKEKMFNKF